GVDWVAKAQTIYDAVSVAAGCVGSYNATADQVSALQAAIADNDKDACKTLVEAIGEKIAFNNKTVYAAKNVNTSLYLRAMDDNLLWAKAGVEYADNDARFQWMVYNDGTDNILYNIAQGGWANNTNSASGKNSHWQIVTDQSTMSYVEIVDAGTMFSFRDRDHAGITVACLHNNTTYTTGITNWNPAPGSTGSGWRFYPIETLSDAVTASVTTLQAYSANKKLIQPYIEIYNNLNMVGYKAATEAQKAELAGYIKDCNVSAADALVNTLGECVLSNAKKYHVYTTRGNLYTDGTVASASTTTASEWAVLKYQDTDHYYFYDVANSKFLGTADLNSLDAPDNNYKVELWGTDKTEHKFTSMANNKLLQMNGVPELTVTSNWTTKDDGDTWFIKEAGDFDATAAMAIVDFYENGKDKLALATAIATAQAYPAGTAVGYYNSTSLSTAIAAAQAVYDAATSTKDDYIAAKAALETAAASALIVPDATKYYYIQNANPAFFTQQGVNKGMYQTGSAPGWNTLNKADLNFVWTWTPKGAGWAVKNVGGGKYLNTTSAMSDTEPSGEISLVWLAAGEWNIKATGGATMHALNHQSGAGVSGTITDWAGGAGSCSAWSIIELAAEDITAMADAQIEEFNKLGGGGIGYYVPTEEGYNAAKAAKETLEGDKTN
ncbi:MAG: hypothetical protein HUK01_09620, partial [Bacteroidaceae bacterium]|nr:hypothetical protein [Bacteroidaceae bacterium]